MAIDIIDAKILEVLQENARVSVSELSKRINLSLSAVSERLKKLESSGVIEQYTAILNPREMHKELTVLMMVSLEGMYTTPEFDELVGSLDEILECHSVTGEYDYVLKVVTDNTATLENIMNRVKSVKSVKRTQTIVYLSDIKMRYSVPPAASK